MIEEAMRLFMKTFIVLTPTEYSSLFLKMITKTKKFNQDDIDVARASPTCKYFCIKIKFNIKLISIEKTATKTGVLVSSLAKNDAAIILTDMKAGRPIHNAINALLVN